MALVVAEGDNDGQAAVRAVREPTLARLPRGDYQRLAPHLRPVLLEFRQVLYEVRSHIDYAYFLTRGVVSTLIFMENGSAIEAATVGNEGVVGLPVFLGPVTSSFQVIVQVPGSALRIAGRALREAADAGGSLRRMLLTSQGAFLAQVAQGAACNGLHTVQQRCCRRLLMTQDGVRGDALPLTHEPLAHMLGVRRACVSKVLKSLEEKGLIRCGRGKVIVLDQDGLESASCECYRAVNDESARLFD